jgi:hypothetical protein
MKAVSLNVNSIKIVVRKYIFFLEFVFFYISQSINYIYISIYLTP